MHTKFTITSHFYGQSSKLLSYPFDILIVFLEKKKKSQQTTMTACADPESFARGGSNSRTFFSVFLLLLMRVEDQIPLKVSHHRSTSETPFKWRFAGGPMMAQH